MTSLSEYEADLARSMACCSGSPNKFVRLAFDWDSLELLGKSPEEWQVDIMNDIENGLLSIAEAIKIATASGHGIGKSALVSWLILWAMSTFPETRGYVTANTERQLTTKTWPELVKWYNRCLTKHWFVCTATSLFSSDPKYRQTWRFDLIPWSKENPDAFAGLHNQGKRILVIFDEASEIWDKIWEVTEGTLTDNDTQILWLAFGNPTKNTGRFFDCFHKFRGYWINRQIDSRTISFTNKKQIEQWVEAYGEDSDFIKVRVRGVFPSQSSHQLISSADIRSAMEREDICCRNLPLVMAIDVARFGDDKSVIRFRQGRDARSFPVKKFAKVDTQFLAREAKKLIDEYNPDAVFVDGGGVGGGVVDTLVLWGYEIIEVNFGEVKSLDQPERYVNKRAEMYDNINDWLKSGGILNDDRELENDLTAIEYFYKGEKMQLLSKEDMKKAGLTSPDDGDALAMTFYCQVKKKGSSESRSFFVNEEYDWSK